MADYNLSEYALEVGKAVAVLAVSGLAFKVAVWIIGLIVG